MAPGSAARAAFPRGGSRRVATSECAQCRGDPGRRRHARLLRLDARPLRNAGAHGPRLAARLRARLRCAYGRPRVDVLCAGKWHRIPGGAVCALLHVAPGPDRALLFAPARLHGLHARRGAVGQSRAAGLLLGSDEPALVPVDRLLAPQLRRARWRAQCARRHGRRRALSLRRRAAPRAHRRQLRPRRGAGERRSHPRRCGLRAGARPARHRCAHEECAVPVPLLAAAGDGGANAGLGVPALRDHGEARCLPARAPVAGARRHRCLDVDRRQRRTGDAGLRRLCRDLPERPQGLLAYSTISHLGLVTVLLGLNSRLALVAALFHVMNHATFKACLFMVAGVIDHETGTRDIRRLNGLYRFMPVTATLALVSAAAMAGVPLLNGFLSKEMFFAEALAVEGPVPLLNRAMPYVAVAWGIFSVAYSLRFIHGVFFGPPPEGLPREPHEPARWMRFPMELLVAACLLVGMLPALTIGPILDAAVASILGADAPEYSLAVWHGFTTPMMMSLAALGGGALLYVALKNYLA